MHPEPAASRLDPQADGLKDMVACCVRSVDEERPHGDQRVRCAAAPATAPRLRGTRVPIAVEAAPEQKKALVSRLTRAFFTWGE